MNYGSGTTSWYKSRMTSKRHIVCSVFVARLGSDLALCVVKRFGNAAPKTSGRVLSSAALNLLC